MSRWIKMSKEIHIAYKLPNGVQVMISGEMKKLLEEYKIQPKDLWKVGQIVGLCVDDVHCMGKAIQVMKNVNFAASTHVFADVSFADDIWCICPEVQCPGAIRHLDPGMALRDPPIYISFKEMAKRIPVKDRKAFVSMLQQMHAEK
jgi:hypothetical protein